MMFDYAGGLLCAKCSEMIEDDDEVIWIDSQVFHVACAKEAQEYPETRRT